MGFALRVIEGGVPRLPAAEAPPLGVPDPTFRPPEPDGFSRNLAFRFAITVSVGLHLLLAAWALFAIGGGEERAAGGTAEEMVIEGIVMVSPDSLPSPPSPPVIEQILGADDAREITDQPVTTIVEAPLVRPRETDAAAKPPETAAAAMSADEARPLTDPLATATPASAPAPIADGMTAAVVEDSPVAEAVTATPLADTAATPPGEKAPEPPPVTAETVPIPRPDDALTPTEIADVVEPVADATAAADEVTEASADRAVKKATPSASTPASAAASPARGPKAGAAGSGGAKADAVGKAALSSYRGRLMSHLRRFQSSPPGGKSGTAVVSFTIAASGKVIGAGLASSSGNSALDRAAVAMVRRASPFPPIPPGGGAQMSVRAPIRFLAR